MRIAIIGTGIAGNVLGYYLNNDHDITVYESNDYIGGHTHTHQFEDESGVHSVDSGFIVFNRKTYPNFVRLLRELDVPWQESDMSFSVCSERNGLEYNGTNVDGLFAQRRNVFNPKFLHMLQEVVRFNRESVLILSQKYCSLTFGEFLKEGGYSRYFIDHYIVPMGAAIWSTSPELMMSFPAQFFIRFFDNHGMLSVDERPTWYVIKNGSNSYVDALTSSYRNRIRLSSPVSRVWRFPDRVEIESKGMRESYDAVFFACHSDQALAMLAEPSDQERKVLSAIPYQQNTAILHSDASVMPKRKRAWASWNYRVPEGFVGKPVLTYHMNRLQRLPSNRDYFVTLNPQHHIDPDLIHKTMSYDHPLFTLKGIDAQQHQKALNGENRSFFCGAYWRYGFHEDGVVSALSALDHFYEWRMDEELSLLRMG